MNDKYKWYAGLAAALLNDLNDVRDFGSKPILGDILDALTSAFLWPLLGKRARAISLIEFLPYADYLPTYTAVLLWSWNRDGPEVSWMSSKKREIPIH